MNSNHIPGGDRTGFFVLWSVVDLITHLCVCVCVLLFFIWLILGNRHGPGVSSRVKKGWESQTLVCQTSQGTHLQTALKTSLINLLLPSTMTRVSDIFIRSVLNTWIIFHSLRGKLTPCHAHSRRVQLGHPRYLDEQLGKESYHRPVKVWYWCNLCTNAHAYACNLRIPQLTPRSVGISSRF